MKWYEYEIALFLVWRQKWKLFWHEIQGSGAAQTIIYIKFLVHMKAVLWSIILLVLYWSYFSILGKFEPILVTLSHSDNGVLIISFNKWQYFDAPLTSILFAPMILGRLFRFRADESGRSLALKIEEVEIYTSSEYPPIMILAQHTSTRRWVNPKLSLIFDQLLSRGWSH